MSKKHAKKKLMEKPIDEPVEERIEEIEEMSIDEPVEEPEVLDEMIEPAEAPGEEGRHRKLIALWLAVGGSMAVIVVLWFVLLPVQIGDLRLPNAADLARWRTLAPASNTNMSLDETLTQIRSRLEKLTNSSQPGPTQQPNTVVNIEALRQKLEAAALRNEAAAPGTNTNEVKE
jgi:hypothetical protein